MESINTKLLENQSARQEKRIIVFISSIIVFTIIISSIIAVLTILKNEVESQSLSDATPSKAIVDVCSLTPHRGLCFKQAWKLQQGQTSSRINPAQIFALSVHASFDQLAILNSTRQRVISKVVNASASAVFPSLQECESLITDALRLVNMSMTRIAIIPDEKIFKETKAVGDLKEWISKAKENLERCRGELEKDIHVEMVYKKVNLVGMKMQVLVARNYMDNNLVILTKMATFVDMFYHPFPSILSNFMLSGSGFDVSIVVFGSQYLILILLFCLFIRL